MSKVYAVSAVITLHVSDPTAEFAINREWTSAVQMPTFYLFADVQGITSEAHAEKIARRMFESLGHDSADVNVCAVETSEHAHSEVQR